ncbi:hypothetical protein C0J52_17995 [Blattella germanica]|nr:hypothetical protein C0J52_17995 [Blattella germanica]
MLAYDYPPYFCYKGYCVNSCEQPDFLCSPNVTCLTYVDCKDLTCTTECSDILLNQLDFMTVYNYVRSKKLCQIFFIIRTFYPVEMSENTKKLCGESVWTTGANVFRTSCNTTMLYRLLNVTILNTMIICRENSPHHKIDHFNFRVDLVEALLVEHEGGIERKVPGFHSTDNRVPRLIERHFPERIPPRENKAKPISVNGLHQTDNMKQLQQGSRLVEQEAKENIPCHLLVQMETEFCCASGTWCQLDTNLGRESCDVAGRAISIVKYVMVSTFTSSNAHKENAEDVWVGNFIKTSSFDMVDMSTGYPVDVRPCLREFERRRRISSITRSEFERPLYPGPPPTTVGLSGSDKEFAFVVTRGGGRGAVYPESPRPDPRRLPALRTIDMCPSSIHSASLKTAYVEVYNWKIRFEFNYNHCLDYSQITANVNIIQLMKPYPGHLTIINHLYGLQHTDLAVIKTHFKVIAEATKKLESSGLSLHESLSVLSEVQSKVENAPLKDLAVIKTHFKVIAEATKKLESSGLSLHESLSVLSEVQSKVENAPLKCLECSVFLSQKNQWIQASNKLVENKKWSPKRQCQVDVQAEELQDSSTLHMLNSMIYLSEDIGNRKYYTYLLEQVEGNKVFSSSSSDDNDKKGNGNTVEAFLQTGSVIASQRALRRNNQDRHEPVPERHSIMRWKTIATEDSRHPVRLWRRFYSFWKHSATFLRHSSQDLGWQLVFVAPEEFSIMCHHSQNSYDSVIYKFSSLVCLHSDFWLYMKAREV